MNKFINALGKSMLTVLIVLLVGYGWAFIEMKILLKPMPELFGYAFYQYKDDDMIPVIDKDDVIIVSKDNEFLNIGDTIMYYLEDETFKVRTLKTADEVSVIVTCDLCEGTEVVQRSTVIGRVVGKFAFLGEFINFFKQKWFLVTLAVIGFALVIVSQYINEKPKKIS